MSYAIIEYIMFHDLFQEYYFSNSRTSADVIL